MDETQRALVVERVRAQGYTRAWKRASGGDELLILVPVPEYDLADATALEAELVPLVRRKVWVTYWRDDAGETEELFDLRDPDAKPSADDPEPAPRPFGPGDDSFVTQLRGRRLTTITSGDRQTFLLDTDALVSIGSQFTLDELELDPDRPNSMLQGSLAMTDLLRTAVVHSEVDPSGALVLRFERGSTLSVPPSATRDAFLVEVRAGDIGTVASLAGGKLARWTRPILHDRARRKRAHG